MNTEIPGSGTGGPGGCAHGIDALTDYLERDMLPADPSIDDSPECQRILRSLRRVRSLATPLMEADEAAVATLDQDWIRGIMENIGREAKAGRDIPFGASDDDAALVITEGTVRGLVRGAGDRTPGVLVGRCVLEGDVTVVGEPIMLHVTVSIGWGKSVAETVSLFREEVAASLQQHTDLVVAGLDVVVDDLHFEADEIGEVGDDA
ncbi:Asp23/Gls24 family envelope stress response protein [Plantibacter cousiniae (nom. nud.)]|uniref:Asp23 family, cell envelope-related function n=1 Tax=Plantibacter cousiniae (nom. nud.) TaxID=199709 RepID=A0ABY1LRY1_9MICO|nr:Asp23/Gls24 family envelope stress response protein [Plantibacter cousiniae]SKC69187.1 hypothetical protein SAMN06295973_2897 [Plantibacter cousiniae]